MDEVPLAKIGWELGERRTLAMSTQPHDLVKSRSVFVPGYKDRILSSDALQAKLRAERLEREAATGVGRVDLVE